MIELKNINIKYKDRTVILNSNLCIQSGKLCLLQGESGSGKSSILEVLALNNKRQEIDYYFNQKEIWNLKESELDDLKLHEISYVSQNCELLGNASVKEQLEFSCVINNTSTKNIPKLLKQLHLTKQKNKKIKKLSGGEKQRVAIASAILKDASLYIFDEPTSMQDEKNKKNVVAQIENLVSNGKMVIVATHESEYFKNYAGYQISKNRIEKTNCAEIEQKVNHKNKIKNAKNRSKSISKWLSRYFLFDYSVLNCSFIITSAFCISLVIALLSVGFNNVQKQETNFAELYQSELLVVNSLKKSEDRWSPQDESYNFALAEDDIERISDINGVETVEPYLYFATFPMGYMGSNPERLEIIPKNDFKVQLIENGMVINECDLFSLYINQEYPIFPYYQHQHFEERCSQKIDIPTGTHGVYISSRLAKHLGIEKLNGQSIHMKIGVPIAEQPSLVGKEEIEGRHPLPVLGEFEFVIIGIIDENIRGNYGIFNEADIFLSIEEIEEIQNEYRENNKDKIENFSQIVSKNLSDDDHIYMLCSEKDWKASAYIVNLSSKADPLTVISEINKIKPNLEVTVTELMTDTVNQDNATTLKRTVMSYSMLVGLTCFVGSVLIHYFEFVLRKKDMHYLNRLGINNQRYMQIIFREINYKVFIGLIVSLISSWGLILYVDRIWPTTILFNIDLVFINICLYVFDIYVSYYISKFIFEKKQKKE